MTQHLPALAAIGTSFGAEPACAQKHGGILKLYTLDSPASMSILEETTVFAQRPMMGVFNNLVMFDQNVKQNSLQSIVPDLATGWSWNEAGTELTFSLRHGVKWHDGKPFTAKDVQCTWDLLTGKSSDKLRLNPRKDWYRNLEEVRADGDYEVTFRLRRPQPSFLVLLGSGVSPVYPCHLPARDMLSHPIGTGPFKFVEFTPNESIKVARTPRLLEKRPALSRRHRIYGHPESVDRGIGIIAGPLDMTWPYSVRIPLLKDIRSQAPQAICELAPNNVSSNLIVNHDAPPFQNPGLRRAMALSLDRKAFIDILSDGQGDIGGVMQPPPEGVWGMSPDVLQTLPGYGPDIQKTRSEAHRIMQTLGYGPDNRLKIKVSTRNTPFYRDPAVILIDQLKEVYIDGELEMIDTTNWYPKVMRKDYTVGLNLTGNTLDDPDQNFYENYACGAVGNYNGYCNPEVDKLIDRQSTEPDQEKRKQLVWEIQRKLAEDGARPIIFYDRRATCLQPYVKGLTIMVNSVFSGARTEDVWLDK
jgi:peptide/nickel transport system substrate-binding protein